jgi:hypothetical protein
LAIVQKSPAARGHRFLNQWRHGRRRKFSSVSFHESVLRHSGPFKFCQPPAAIGSSTNGDTGGGKNISST